MQKIKDFFSTVKYWILVGIEICCITCISVKCAVVMIIGIFKMYISIKNCKTIDDKTRGLMINMFLKLEEVIFDLEIEDFIYEFERKFFE